ncbi:MULTISPECIES: hypothetical protein [unclassified Paenibacillus]|uniref:hypothetical protein n=1 Tax=unclassified Paenibacillus TaxID=185978 RepID=UPI0030F77207
MRVNRLWAINKWLPVSKAMGPIRELYMNKEKIWGFSGLAGEVNQYNSSTLMSAHHHLK